MRYYALLVCIAFFMIANSSHVQAQETTTLWYPYAEWSFQNPSHSGNPFDLEARATFSDGAMPYLFYDGGDAWKLRYMCTGTGTFTFSVSSSDPDLDGRTGSVACLDNPGGLGPLVPSGQDNKKWYVRGWEKAIIPAWVMMPDFRKGASISLDDQKLDTWLDNNLDSTGFIGVHMPGPANKMYDWDCDGTTSDCSGSSDPDPRTFRKIEGLLDELYSRGAFLHLWLWGDKSRKIHDQYMNDPAERKRLRNYIADRLGAYPNIMIGHGFDNYEYVSSSHADEWANDLLGRFAWPKLIGMRGDKNVLHPVLCEDCSYTSFETLEMTYSKWKASYDAVSGEPVFEEDRFRVRDEGRDKDVYSPDEQMREHMWPQVMVGGVGAIYGYLLNSGGMYTGTSGYPDSYRVSIKAWHDFWYETPRNTVHRFFADMEKCNSLTDGWGLCTQGVRYVFYKPDTNSIQFDVSGMGVPANGIAVDTRKSYSEISLGQVSGPRTWNAPYKSDWAIAVGDFSSDAPPPTCPNGECDPDETCEQDGCCSGQPYDNSSQGCCSSVVFDSASQVCCSGLVHEGHCCSDPDCTQGLVCNQTTFICEPPPPECSIDGDCPSGEICCSRQCIIPECSGPEDCGTDTCRDYICSKPGTCQSACSSVTVTACTPGDLCCPPGCDATDPDCAGMEITGLTTNSKEPYEVAENLSLGDHPYTDRTYLYNNLPDYVVGEKYIRTANDDKRDLDFQMSFSVNRPAEVYVAHDDRYSTKPSWLIDFQDTGDGLDLDVPFSLFVKEYPAGTINLGSNLDSSENEDNSMYTVILKARIAVHRADQDWDRCIDMDELIRWVGKWKGNSHDYPMAELMQAVSLWRSGQGCS